MRLNKVKNNTEEEYEEQDQWLGIWHTPIQDHNVQDSNYIELDVYQDVYKQGKTPDDYVLVKKDVLSKKTIWKDDIAGISQVVNKQGLNRTTRVQIDLKYKDPIIVKGNYKTIKQVIYALPKQNNKPVGFKFY